HALHGAGCLGTVEREIECAEIGVQRRVDPAAVRGLLRVGRKSDILARGTTGTGLVLTRSRCGLVRRGLRRGAGLLLRGLSRGGRVAPRHDEHDQSGADEYGSDRDSGADDLPTFRPLGLTCQLTLELAFCRFPALLIG